MLVCVPSHIGWFASGSKYLDHIGEVNQVPENSISKSLINKLAHSYDGHGTIYKTWCQSCLERRCKVLSVVRA